MNFYVYVCFFKQKTAYEMLISDWSSDVFSSELQALKVTQLSDNQHFSWLPGMVNKPPQGFFGAWTDALNLGGREFRDRDNLTMLAARSEEHTSELQSLMRISYAVFSLKKKNTTKIKTNIYTLTEYCTKHSRQYN